MQTLPKVVLSGDHPALRFAADELRRYFARLLPQGLSLFL